MSIKARATFCADFSTHFFLQQQQLGVVWKHSSYGKTGRTKMYPSAHSRWEGLQSLSSWIRRDPQKQGRIKEILQIAEHLGLAAWWWITLLYNKRFRWIQRHLLITLRSTAFKVCNAMQEDGIYCIRAYKSNQIYSKSSWETEHACILITFSLNSWSTSYQTMIHAIVIKEADIKCVIKSACTAIISIILRKERCCSQSRICL